MFEYDKEKHRYTYAGIEMPSVTQIISDVLQTGKYLKDKQSYGKMFHLATELYDKGILDEMKLDDRLKPALEKYKQVKKQLNLKYKKIESPVYSMLNWVAGCIDRVTEDKRIIDIKTGVILPYYRLQTAAYQNIWEEMYGEKIKGRLILQITREGKTKIEEYTDAQDIKDWLSVVRVYKIKRRAME